MKQGSGYHPRNVQPQQIKGFENTVQPINKPFAFSGYVFPTIRDGDRTPNFAALIPEELREKEETVFEAVTDEGVNFNVRGTAVLSKIDMAPHFYKMDTS